MFVHRSDLISAFREFDLNDTGITSVGEQSITEKSTSVIKLLF